MLQKNSLDQKTGTAVEDFQTCSYIFVLFVVSSPLRLLVGLVGLRVHTPHALSPLPIDDAVLLFTGQGERQRRQEEERQEEEKGEWTTRTRGDGSVRRAGQRGTSSSG